MLEQYRNEIDQLDQEILQLLDKRFNVTKLVGEYKRENSIDVLNQNREDAIINKIKAQNLENEAQIIAVYIAMMNISKDQQNG